MKISVIIPFFNAHEDINFLFQSLVKQKNNIFEVVIIDDGSKKPLTVTSNLNYKIIRNKTNIGPAASRNIGIKEASGEVLLFIDSDCVANDQWVSNYMTFFNDNKINIISSGARIVTKNRFSYLVSLLGYPAGGNLGCEKMWQVFSDRTISHVTTCNFGIRKKVIEKKNLFFDESFSFGCEDVYFSYLCSRKQEKIYFFEENHVFHKPVPGFFYFLKWHFIRGRSSCFLRKKGISISVFFFKRLRSFVESFKIARGIGEKFLVTSLFFLQLVCQFAGNVFQNLSFFIKFFQGRKNI